MKLEEVQGTSKKTGKPFTGYVVKIGEYSTPMFFPSKVELIYIKEQLANNERQAFQQQVYGDDVWSSPNANSNL